MAGVKGNLAQPNEELSSVAKESFSIGATMEDVSEDSNEVSVTGNINFIFSIHVPVSFHN